MLPPDGDPRAVGVSEALLGAVDEEVRRIVEERYQEARDLLAQHSHRLDAIVERLLERETSTTPRSTASPGSLATTTSPRGPSSGADT